MSEDVLPYGTQSGTSRLIRNCRFAFRCKQQWEDLTDTEDPRARFCGECQRRVVLCERDAELHEALRQNDCVAIPVTLLGAGPDCGEPSQLFVGQVLTSYGR